MSRVIMGSNMQQRRIWALADPHLSFAHPKPMDIFGAHWANHAERIQANCRKLVEQDDLLLIPGDISWAMKRKDAEVDLAFLAALPGIKVLCKGNHDYWWNSDKPLNCPGLNDTPYHLADLSVGVAGTRGWLPTTSDMAPEQRKSNNDIIKREVSRLDKRLSAIEQCQVKYVIVHYPPLEEFWQIIDGRNVTAILYGHLHVGESEEALPDRWHGLRSLCVAADRIKFAPKLVQTL
jgi:uncharacterized protein